MKLLGTGAFGSVAAAHDTLLGMDVAVKRIRDGVLRVYGLLERVYREVTLLRQLRHPNIACLLGVSQPA